MTQEASVDHRDMRQRERLVKAIAKELGAMVVATGGKIERKEDYLVAELYYQPDIIWVLEFPVKVMILVKGDRWKGFYALWDDGDEASSAIRSYSEELIWSMRPRDPEDKAILPPITLSEKGLEALLNKLRQEGFTL